MASTSPVSIVLIDDDPLQLRLMEKRLKESHPKLSVGQVFTYTEAGEALANMPAQGPVAILCDFDMPDSTGLDWMADLIRQDVGPVLMLTATGDERIASSAFRQGASDYLLKADVATDIGKLKHAVADAMRRYDMFKRNKQFARELKLANQKLHERNEVLTEMTRTAHRFVDNVAHDFRTPLTVIQEFVSILTDGIGGELTDKQIEFLGYVDASARDLNAMVDDFLDSSKLKAQTLRVHRAAVSMQSIFTRVRPTLETRAHSKSIELVYEVDQTLPEVFADSEKIGRVLINLVINAIKFSPEQSTIHVKAESAGAGEVLVSVQDQGVGIAEDELPKVCERFSQVTDPRRSVAKGFGLGLNIARDLVWVNLGQMRISSVPGQGSNFAFTIPVNDPEAVAGRYAQRISESDETMPLTLLCVSLFNPSVPMQDLIEDLSAGCRSMDLVLPIAGRRCVYVVGPTDQPDRWMDRLKVVIQQSADHREQPNPVKMAWLGTWSQEQAPASVVSMIHNDLEEKACA